MPAASPAALAASSRRFFFFFDSPARLYACSTQNSLASM